jgi:hypothetical protein
LWYSLGTGDELAKTSATEVATDVEDIVLIAELLNIPLAFS